MATGTHIAFNHSTVLLGSKKIDFANDTFKVVALAAMPTGAETKATQLSAATGLAAATKTLAGGSFTGTATNDAKYDANDLTFTATATAAIAGFAIIDDSITSPLDAPISYGVADTGTASVSLAAGEKLKFQWAATGVDKITTP